MKKEAFRYPPTLRVYDRYVEDDSAICIFQGWGEGPGVGEFNEMDCSTNNQSSVNMNGLEERGGKRKRRRVRLSSIHALWL